MSHHEKLTVRDRLDAVLNAASYGVAVLGAMCLVAVLVVLLGHWGIFGGTP